MHSRQTNGKCSCNGRSEYGESHLIWVTRNTFGAYEGDTYDATSGLDPELACKSDDELVAMIENLQSKMALVGKGSVHALLNKKLQNLMAAATYRRIKEVRPVTETAPDQSRDAMLRYRHAAYHVVS